MHVVEGSQQEVLTDHVGYIVDSAERRNVCQMIRTEQTMNTVRCEQIVEHSD